MKKVVIATALLCWGAQPLAAPAPVVEAGANTSQPGGLAERVARLEQQMQARSRAHLQLQQILDQMQREVSELRGQVENQNYQMEQMLDRQRQLYKELSNVRNGSRANTPVASTPAPAKPVGSLSEADAYNQALNLATKERKFDDAIAAFRQFIQQYPQSGYTANAHYWLGQLLYNKGELAEAASIFATVSNDYPKSSKRSDSLLKQGLIAQKQGNGTEAAAFFRQVVADYPGSSAAKMAQKQLN